MSSKLQYQEKPGAQDEAVRQEFQEAYERYQAATARYRRMLEREPKGQIRSPNHPLTVARRAESVALAEYTRLLKTIGVSATQHGGASTGDNGDGDSDFNRG